MRPSQKSAANKSAAKKPQKSTASPLNTRGLSTPDIKHLLLAGIALCGLVVIAYANSVGNGFVWDDHRQIVMNPAVQPGAHLAPLVTTDARFANFDPANQTTVYRPLQMLTYRALLTVFGANPTAFHVCSVVFAMTGALAAMWLFWLLTRSLPMAFATAALFAVYPVHAEAVDWIAALPDLGCGLFFLLAFALYLVRQRWLSVAAFAIALLWKETALVFPVLLAVYVLLQPSASRLRDSMKASAPYWIVVAAYLGVRTVILGAISHSPRSWLLNPLQFFLSVMQLLLSYWVKLAWPMDLNAYYVFHPIRSLGDARGWLAIVFLVCVGAAIYFLRRSPLAIFAIAWVTLTLLPALNLNALGRNAFAERYLYLPSAGFCLLLALSGGWLLGRVPEKARMVAGAVALIAIVSAFTVEIIARNPDWKDDATLFAATLPDAQDSPFVHMMIASLQPDDHSEGSYAEQNYRQAVDLAKRETPPDRLDAVAAYQGLASLYSDRGQFDQALNELAQAREMAPNNPDADGEEGIILAHAGRGKQAEPLLERALVQQPHNENILTALGMIAREDEHDLPRAASLFSQVLAVHTEADDFSASAHNNLGVVLGDENNYAAAVEQFRQAAAIDPGDPEFHMNLASSLASMGRLREARAEAETALKLAPDNPAVRDLAARIESPNP
jgi:protein O-mannosyl-transferase